jgi:hypothetical protein
MTLDRSAALMEAEMISEAFAGVARAENRHEAVRARVYVVDDLVLAITERDPAAPPPHGTEGRARARPVAAIRRALQRRATVEAVTGRRVAAALSGRRSDPEVRFELFVLASDDGTRASGAV